jgi:hypothetical protein
VGPQLAGGIRSLGALAIAVAGASLAVGTLGRSLPAGAAQWSLPAGPPPVVAGRQLLALEAIPHFQAKRDLWLTQISARIARPRVGLGRQVGVIGVLPSGERDVRVTLQLHARGIGWQPIAWARSGAGGRFRLSGSATRSGLARVVVDGTDGDRRSGLGSAPRSVVVQPLLGVRGVPGNLLWERPAVVSGRLIGAGPNRPLLLQQRRRGQWRTVAATRTELGGRFRLTYMTHSRAPLRVRYAGGGDLGAVGRVVQWRGAGAGPIGGGLGIVRLTAHANNAGSPLTPQMTKFATLIAGAYGRRLVITVGTNHSPYTVGGSISDHWSGNAADFGMSANHGTPGGPVGDRIAAAALVAAGLPPAEALAKARAGGATTVTRGGRRVQVIWKSYIGGNHYSHVHVGIGH